jgi:hypothetical protein
MEDNEIMDRENNKQRIVKSYVIIKLAIVGRGR